MPGFRRQADFGFSELHLDGGVETGISRFASRASQELAAPLGIVRESLPQFEPANAGIHLVLGHIDTDDNEVVLCHRPLPSLLGSGSKPFQLFGLRKIPELSLALITRLCRLWGVTGSVPATGGFAEPPVRTFWQILQTQGAYRDRHGRWVRDAVDALALQDEQS
jgi:hypothetical protein